jgi:hypothetical protein
MSFDLTILNDEGNSPYLPQVQEPVVLHTEFPELIDNTARELFFTCPQKFFRSTIQKLGPRFTSPHLHFGGAFAAGLEAIRKSAYDEGASDQEALDAGLVAAIKFWGDYVPPEDHLKNFENLLLALDYYVTVNPPSTDHIRPIKLSSGKHAIEFNFALPLPDTKHPVTGNPILYGGRFDMFAEFNNAPFIMDDKTTSRLGPTWRKQWVLNSQMTGYCWAAKEYGMPVVGAIIRGQSILSKSFDSLEEVVYRPPWMMERWLEQLIKDVHRMIAAWEQQSYDYAIGSACAAYGGCEFLRLCQSPNPESWIKTDYKNKHWNPLSKDPEAGDTK